METNFSRVMDALPGLVWTALADGRADFVNRRWCDYTGLSFEEACGHGWQAAIHPDDRPGLLAAWRSFTAAGQPGELEARLRRSDGEHRWFQFRASQIPDPTGETARWCGVGADIDDRKRADDALRAQERRAQLIIDDRQWVETLLAGEKRLLEMVARGLPLAEVLEALCGVVEDAAPGCLCSILSIDPDGVRFRHGAGPSLPAAYNEVLDGLIMDRCYGPCGMAAQLKTQVIAADVESDPRWTSSPWPALVSGHGLRSCWSTPILSGDERVIGVFAVYKHAPSSPDPHEQELIRQFTHIASIAIERAQNDASLRRSEEALRRSNAHLAEAQRVSLTGSFTWNPITNEYYWSDEMYRIFEYDPSEKISPQKVNEERLHPDDLPRVEELLSKAAVGENFSVECRAVMKTGQVKYLHIIGHKEQDLETGPQFLGAIRDVTERRIAEEALSNARSELTRMARVTSLGALTASIAHEVNQPLSGIITNASTCLKMLAADPPNVQGAQETARRTVRDGNRAADIIKRLRALFGKRDPASGPLDLNEAAREVIALSQSDLQRSRAVVRTELAEDLPMVEGDRVQLQQVILNLILNAADAMSGVEDRPRELVVRTWLEDEDRMALAVRDVGVGLEPQAADKLFEAFYTTKDEGMGIGLSISRSIIEHHGGSLWAAPNEGPGATFAFSVPLAPMDAALG